MDKQQNLKVVQDAYAAFGRGDFEGVLSKLSDDVDWFIPGPANEVAPMGRWRGHEGVREFFRVLAESQDAEQFEPQRFIAQDDLVVVLGHYKWLVKATGRSTESDWVHVFTLHDGLVTKFQEYTDTANFMEAYRAQRASV